MTFSEALDSLKCKDSVARAGWNGKNMWIKAQFPDVNSKMQEPYLYMKNAQGKLIPWLCSQGDIFATDWYRIE